MVGYDLFCNICRVALMYFSFTMLLATSPLLPYLMHYFRMLNCILLSRTKRVECNLSSSKTWLFKRLPDTSPSLRPPIQRRSCCRWFVASDSYSHTVCCPLWARPVPGGRLRLTLWMEGMKRDFEKAADGAPAVWTDLIHGWSTHLRGSDSGQCDWGDRLQTVKHILTSYMVNGLHSPIHAHIDCSVNHARPARRESLGWGVSLRDTSTLKQANKLGGAGEQTSNLVVSSQSALPPEPHAPNTGPWTANAF